MKKDKDPKKDRSNPNNPQNPNDEWHTPNPFKGTGFFDGFEDQFKRMEQRMNELIDQMMKGNQPYQNDPNTKVYGWSYQVGQDGKPHFQEFGNLPEMQSSPSQEKLPQPQESPIDIQEGDKEIYVTLELPGVEKEDINLEVIDTTLKLEVTNGKRPYRKEIELNNEVNEKKTEATYNNGILSITLEKRKTKKKGKKINIK